MRLLRVEASVGGGKRGGQSVGGGHSHFRIVVALHAERHHAVLHHLSRLWEPFIPARQRRNEF